MFVRTFLFLILASSLTAPAAGGNGDAPNGATPPDQTTTEAISKLISQNTRMLEEIERTRSRLETLARAIRERERDNKKSRTETDVLIAALGSDDYATRVAATITIRRALVDDLWRLIETPELPIEARHRLKSLIVEGTAMLRLTKVAVDLRPEDRDALWNLLDAEPAWTLDALGDAPERIEHALRHPPVDHDLAVEIVFATLIRDPMRPLSQTAALNAAYDATRPLLRQALLSLIAPAGPRKNGLAGRLAQNREKNAIAAIRILLRQPPPGFTESLVEHLRSTQTFSARLEFTIIEALASLGARHTVGALLQIASEKRTRMSGAQRFNEATVVPGDCELIAAALLLGIDVAELNVHVRRSTNDREPTYYGFIEVEKADNPDRLAAYAAVREVARANGLSVPPDGADAGADTDKQR